ncbi:hypothetical protein [Clostridium sp.]|uniref:hypothetical protein n=1 Tax=Clostridium sp. TaxID=1506 RepID=UPI003D6CF6BD
MALIFSNMSLDVLESRVRNELTECEIWGDLDISEVEYNKLNTKLKSELGDFPTTSRLKLIMQKYPVLFVTDIVNYVLYDYNRDFWSGWASRFDISLPPNNQTDIGKIVLKIFETYKYEIIDDGGHTYVTPILCQAGIPSANFDVLFDIIESTLEIPNFMPNDLIDELVGYRSYLVGSPVERYFRLHRDKAVDLIIQIREMMQEISGMQNSEMDITPEIEGVAERLVKKYLEWNSEVKGSNSNLRKKTQYYISPKLTYDEICKGICLLLPGQILRNESIYKLEWKIICENKEGTEKTIISQVYDSSGKFYTLDITVPVECAESYRIELWDDLGNSLPLQIWNTIGLGSENPYLIFDYRGLLVSNKQIPHKKSLLVLDRNAKISVADGINKSLACLPKSWSVLDAYNLAPETLDAYMTIETGLSTVELTCKQYFDVELLSNGNLFGEKYNYKEIPVFTKWPSLQVGLYSERQSDILFCNWQLVLRHQKTQKKFVINVKSLIEDTNNPNGFISLAKFAEKNFLSIYGTYDLRLYEGKSLKKYFSFRMSPYIEYIENSGCEWPSEYSNVGKTGFSIKKYDDISIDFSSVVSRKSVHKRNCVWEEISTTEAGAYINGTIKVISNDSEIFIPFKKNVRKLQWSFWSENKDSVEECIKTRLFYDDDLKTSNWWLSLHFDDSINSDDLVEILLETPKKEVLQIEEVRLNDIGDWAISINKLQTTIEAHAYSLQLPISIMLHEVRGYNEHRICLAIVRERVLLKNPKYTIKNEKCIIYWQKNKTIVNKKLKLVSFNDPMLSSVEQDLDCARKMGETIEGIILNNPLEPGTYYVDAEENIDFFIFDDDAYKPPVYNSEHIVHVKRKEMVESLINNKSNLLVDWLSVLAVSMDKIQWLDIIYQKLTKKIELEKLIFEDDKCEKLLIMLLINASEKSNLLDENKKKIKGICTIINYNIISDIDRGKILKTILESDLSEQEFMYIVNELQLYHFKYNETLEFSRQCKQKMWDINRPLAILINLRSKVSDREIDLERIEYYLDRKVLEKIILIKPSNECPSSEWNDCAERIIRGKCICKYSTLEYSKNVWGDVEDFLKLFIPDKGRGNWRLQELETSKSDGYEFMGRSYLSIIYELMSVPSNDRKVHIEAVKKERPKLEILVDKYLTEFYKINKVLKYRLNGGANDNHKLFFNIGCASYLEALALHGNINSEDLHQLLPFWKSIMYAFPELAYRDIILSELFVIFQNERG